MYVLNAHHIKCRYLGTGSDSASLYLRVTRIEGADIICEACNGAVMDGLMTVSCRMQFELCSIIHQ